MPRISLAHRRPNNVDHAVIVYMHIIFSVIIDLLRVSFMPHSAFVNKINFCKYDWRFIEAINL